MAPEQKVIDLNKTDDRRSDEKARVKLRLSESVFLQFLCDVLPKSLRGLLESIKCSIKFEDLWASSFVKLMESLWHFEVEVFSFGKKHMAKGASNISLFGDKS